MVIQVRNDSMVDLLRADFFARNEPNASWSHAISDHLLLPALRGLWPMSAHHIAAQAAFVNDIACVHDLTMINTPELQLAGYGLPPCAHFTIANSEYLTYSAHDIQHGVIGNETTVLAAQRGLTVGTWVKFDTSGADEAIISKWEQTIGNQRSYLLHKNAADNIVFSVSTNGAAVVSVTSTQTLVKDIWYHVMGRFVPSTALDVYVDAVRTTNAAGVPATLHDSTEPLQMARYDRANYLGGYLSLAWIAASICWDGVAATRDVIPFALYEHSKKMFNR